MELIVHTRNLTISYCTSTHRRTKSIANPPQIIKQLPNSTSEKLSKNSDLKYTNSKSEKTKTRTRNKIWFNPPFRKSVLTNVAKGFPQLVTKHFRRRHKLHKIFNLITVKASCSCLNNMSRIIKGNNQKDVSKLRDQSSKCSCENKAECPVERNCQANNVVLKCEVIRPLPKKFYLGLAQGEWKSRFYNHNLNTRDITTRQCFQVTCGTGKAFQVKHLT